MSKDFVPHQVETERSPVEEFSQFLQRRGKRITQQRLLIVEQVFSHHDHFDADELMGHLQQLIQERRVSRPTVYRTLGELVEAGMLRTMTLDGRSVYEHDYGYPRHDHLHCTECGELIEFHSPLLDRLRDDVARQHDFLVTGHRLLITGICRKCRAKHKGRA